MSLERLREACRGAGIGSVGFIDDIFDVPSARHIDKGSYRDFVAVIAGGEGRDAVLRRFPEAAALATRDLGVLDEEDLAPFWGALVEAGLEGAPDEPALAPARRLFAGHAHDVLGMLETVTRICLLFSRSSDARSNPSARSPTSSRWPARTSF